MAIVAECIGRAGAEVFYGSKSVDKNGTELLIRVTVEARAESVDELSFRPRAVIRPGVPSVKSKLEAEIGGCPSARGLKGSAAVGAHVFHG